MPRKEEKPIKWLGTSQEDLRDFPPKAMQRCGYQLELVQFGEEPDNWKPMASIGSGVREIRVTCEGAYRVFYVADRADAIYVLHALKKTSQKTEKRDIELAKERLRSLD
jgi:phage-related protein